MRASTIGMATMAAFGVQAVYLAPNDQEMFDESMTFMDNIYDPAVGYLYDFYGGQGPAAGTHVTRSSIWYAAGLLQRNQGDDCEQAKRVIRNIIDGQHDNRSELWFGDYQVYPDEATVDLPMNKASAYGNWDPNWRSFIGNVMIIIYEEFGSQLDDDTKSYILESMYNVTLGETYRLNELKNGGLVPAYSNPSAMRAVMASWTGRQLNDQNLTDFGENWGQLFIEAFDAYGTLPEFNSGTYSAVTIWALTLWAKYLPEESPLKTEGERILKATWAQLGETYNANMKNLAGPWDRSYGYDMNRYYAILTTYIWSFHGRQLAPVYPKATWSMAHADDFEYTPVIAVLADFHNKLVPQETKDKFKCFTEDHWYNATAWYPPRDLTPRNITVWNSANLTIGAESFAENSTLGDQFNPAVVQWKRYDGSIGYMTLFAANVKAMDARVGAGWLDLTYPASTNVDHFEFVVSTNPYYSSRDILSLDDVVGVDITVGGNVKEEPVVGYCGQKSGTCKPIHGFEFWNYTFVRQDGISDPVNIHLSFELDV